jgi:two-component system, OmpR family, response regulator QseB
MHGTALPRAARCGRLCATARPASEPSSAMRVLIIEDDPLLGAGLQTGLRQEGCTADWVQQANAAAHALQTEHFDAAVLDLGLPDRDGLSLLDELRKKGLCLPVLILTARDALEDRVAGLDAGADDYLVKPFDLAELSARLRALMRRSQGKALAVFRAGDLVVDTVRRDVKLRGCTLSLSPKEFALLEVLVSDADGVVPRARLHSTAFGWHHEVESNALDVHMHNLRRKLGKYRIVTVRGVGYQLLSRDKP